jgi:hypothetical protein
VIFRVENKIQGYLCGRWEKGVGWKSSLVVAMKRNL